VTKKQTKSTMGRPKIYSELSQPTTIRMERDLLGRFDDRCQQLGLLRSQGVAEAITLWMGASEFTHATFQMTPWPKRPGENKGET
jgi:hypothetical protein